MRTSSARTFKLLSILVAGAAAAPLGGGCGGKAEAEGASPAAGGTSSGSSGAPNDPPALQPSDCGSLLTTTSTFDPLRCEPQRTSTTRYSATRSGCGGRVCSWTVERACSGDAGTPDADADADGDAAPGDPHELCVALCNAAAPPGADPASFCSVRTPDGGDGIVVSCGGCGVGRPPKGFVALEASAISDEGQWLARMAQLEAASVHAFRALRDDLACLGAPQGLLRDLQAAGDDEVRHARAVRLQAERVGAVVPEVGAPARRRRSLEEIAIENIEEGCVNETFGAAIAAIQAEHASDPRIRGMMRTIAREELRHAALSWQVAAWLDLRLDVRARALVDEARLGALASLEAELAKGGKGLPSLGVPDAARALGALEAIRAVLESGELARAA